MTTTDRTARDLDGPAMARSGDSQATGADVRTCAEDVLYLLAAHGVEVLFLNPGTDSAPVQEASAALAARGGRQPRVVPCSFEAVALAAAHGYWQATGRPQAVWVHVDAGTQNLGAMVHNVLRDRAGVVVLAGRTPYGEGPDDAGGRDAAIHWQQDVPDQAGIVRSYAKWTAELVRPEDAPRVVGRAVQVAGGGIPGLAYLTISRDVLMQGAAPGHRHRLTGWARPHPAALAPAAVEEIAGLIATAERPVLITTRVGRRPGAAAAVTRFAELAAVPVVGRPEAVNIASGHPMARFGLGDLDRHLQDADLVLVVESDVPWIPKETHLSPKARVVHIDPDPLHSSMPLWSYPVDVSATADGGTALGQLADALEARLADCAPAWEERRHRLSATSQGAQTPQGAPTSEGAGGTTAGAVALSPADVLRVVAEVLDTEDVVVEEAVTNAGHVAAYVSRSVPGTLSSAGGPGLGWALGASVGIRLANPGRRVVALVGDGSFMFGVPTAALCLAAEAEAPFVAVVLDNDGYRASRLPVFDLFPRGVSAAAGDAIGTRFRRPPDFAAVAEACGALGRDAADERGLRSALEDAFGALSSGRAAVVRVRVNEPG